MGSETPPEKQPDSSEDGSVKATGHLDNVNQVTKGLESFVNQLARLIVTKNWVSLLLLTDAVFLLFLNPVVLKTFLSPFKIELIENYALVYWIIVGGIFIAALGNAVRIIAKKSPTLPDVTERKAIKGLRAFSKKDAEIFAQLQRGKDLQECLESITSKTFRLGILMGESGAGKTSFLQAGIIPQLERENSTHQGIYIRFSNQDPITTIYQALKQELSTPTVAINERDLLEILSWAVDTADKPLIFIFDQFEQFFVHFKQKPDRKPFIDALKSWYCAENPLAVKIIISIRGDLADKLIELQKALGYSLSPYEVFRLERFSPEEATKILQVIAGAEEIEFDERFVQELTRDELASREDGLISPVDLQVLAWTIERQNTLELQAFNRSAFQKIGGIEGLMTRFLKTILDTSIIPQQRETAIKVLLAMTDFERNLRAGVLTLDDLQQEIPGTLPGEIVAATIWLASGGVRLITSVDQDSYELAHERLIPALREVAGKELTSADRASQLLDRRVNEWLGNQRSSRYLFNLPELRLLKQQKSYLMWGANESNKKRLLKASWGKLFKQLIAVVMALILALSGMGWWHTPWGQIQQVRWRLASLSQQVDYESRGKAALAFFKDEDLSQALKIIDSIKDSGDKARVLISIAETYGKLENLPQADKYLTQAIAAAEKIDDSDDKAKVLITIAEAYGKRENLPQADKYLTQAIAAVEKIDDSDYKAEVLITIAETYGKLKKLPLADKYLAQVITAVKQIDDSGYKARVLTSIIDDSGYKARVLIAIAETYGKLENFPLADKYLAQVITAAKQIDNSDDQARVLIAIAGAYGKLGNLPQADKYLNQVITVAERIDDSYSSNKAWVLRFIAETYGKLENLPQADKYLTQAIAAAEKIDDSSSKAWVLRSIAETYGKLENLPQADKYLAQAIADAEKINDSDDKARVLRSIAETYGKFSNLPQADKYLAKSVDAAEKIDDSSNKARVLITIAETYGKRENLPQADKYLAQANAAAEKIDDSYEKARVLITIAKTYGKRENLPQADKYLAQANAAAEKIDNSYKKTWALKNIRQTQLKYSLWRQAHNTVNSCPDNKCKVESLSNILTAWAEKKNPALVEKEED